MGQHRSVTTRDTDFVLQEAIDASDVIGRWRYDVLNDRLYTDALVALVLNMDPAMARAGIPLTAFIAGIHPDDREKAARQFMYDAAVGGHCVVEYRVCSADGATRWVLDRGHIEHDARGCPVRGHGVLIDMTPTRREEGDATNSTPAQHPLERAAEHCLAFNRTIHELPESVLHRMSDMLLLELGLALARIADRPAREAMN